jgi:hypothetical protein
VPNGIGGSSRERRCDLAPRNPEALKQAWVDFLGRWPWEWFCTLTFEKVNVHPEHADKCFRVWVSMANRLLYGRRWSKLGRGVTWVRALEYQRRGAIHYHALMTDIGNLRRLTLMDRWHQLAGFARIEAVKNQEWARKYVAKYVVKKCDIDLGGPGLVRGRGPSLF